MSRAPQPRIGQEPSRLRQAGIPIATVMAGSLLTLFPFVATAPSLPSLGLCFLLAWRVLHRDLWPVWIALPLGLFDDLFSGQPLGSAMMLWTICFLILDVVDRRYIWRDFPEEWTLASLLILGVGIGGLVIANLTGGDTALIVMLPQLLLTILLFPCIARFCAHIDKWRF